MTTLLATLFNGNALKWLYNFDGLDFARFPLTFILSPEGRGRKRRKL
jgi:hypothetical protein